MSSEEIRFRRIARPSELTMSPSGILQRCLCQPTAFFSRWFGPKGNEHRTAGIAVFGGEGGAGAYGMNDGGGSEAEAEAEAKAGLPEAEAVRRW